MNQELPDIQARFRKGRRTRDQIANICGIIEKSKRVSEKHLLQLHWLTPKNLTVWITTNCGKFLKRWEYQTTYLSPEKPVFGSRSKSELDLEERADSKLGKEYIKVVYCYPVYLTSMQSTSWEMSDWMKHKLESRLPGEIQITSDMQTIPSLWQKAKRK